MKLIVALGNPGAEYARSRHNAGFIVVEHLAQRHGLARPKAKFHGATLDGVIAGQRCTLLQPTTYMNRSGLAVAEAVNFYKLDPAADLLIVIDDVALPCGRLRLRAAGGPGGHNGLADVERVLATQDYPRLRIGIDATPPSMTQSDYVLGQFTAAQFQMINDKLDTACDAIEHWLTRGIEAAMNAFNATT